MRKAIFLAVTLAMLLPAAAAPPQRAEPFVPVGVWYGGGAVRPPIVSRDPARERDAWRHDLRTIRSLGFNSVRSWVSWAAAEPQRGTYDVAALDQMLTLAGETGLQVIVQMYTDSAPEWLSRRYTDAGVVSDRGVRAGARAVPAFCVDHPGVRDDLVSFIGAVAARAAQHRAFHAIDVWSAPHIVNPAASEAPVEFCYCRYTQARFREWLKQKYGTLEALNTVWSRTFSSWDEPQAPRDGPTLSRADLIDWKTFVAVKLREDLELKAEASAARGAGPVSSHSDEPSVMLSPLSGFGNPDDWWMNGVVDRYGTSIYPKHAEAAPWSPVRLAFALDGIRSAARDKGWWAGQLQAGQGAASARGAAPVTGADLRLWGWTAISRGARAISYYAWHPMGSGNQSNGYGMIELDGTVTERAKAAGEFAGIIARNPGLFSPLRPRASKIAILYDRLSHLTGGNTKAAGPPVRDPILGFYRAMFERNIQTDFIHPDEILAGAASRYSAIVLGSPLTLPQPIAAALDTYVRGGGTLIREARPVAELAGVTPDIRISGAPGLVEARFLESADALLLIAINHSDAPQSVIMTFSPDTPEAIWQNLENGTSVNFVMGKEGPYLTHAFAPRDVLVLVIRKRLR